MRANMFGFARPVRRVARSLLAESTALSIFSSASKSSSSSISRSSSRHDQGAHRLAEYGAPDVALHQQVENYDGHLGVHAQGEGGCVRNLETTLDHLAVTDHGEHLGTLDLARVGVVDPVHLL